MIDNELLMQLIVIAIELSVITTAFIQKTKGVFKTSKYITLYGFIVNVISAVLFCKSFTEASVIQSLWVGLFGFVGADTIYKTLEGKLKSFGDIVDEKVITIDRGE